MELTESQKKKQLAIDVLRRRYAEQKEQVAAIEPRLASYIDDICEHSGVELGNNNDWHNYYEILSAIKFLRLLRTYQFNTKMVLFVLKMFEGEWKNDGNGWRHVSGGIKQPGTEAPTVYRWEDFQVFIFANIFGFYADVDTKLTAEDRTTLLKTERMGEDGHIYDRRRLCTAFTLFAPRKINKTGLSAAVGTVSFAVTGDHNCEVYCCANSKDQSMILFKRIKEFVQQINADRFRMTASVVDWKQQYKHIRNSSVTALSAGGKTKDGMYGEVLLDDESGSSAWVNGHSDLFSLINVIASSMGPRRQPLQLSTTTAGTITSGFFIEKLDGLHRLLEEELAYDASTSQPKLELDRTLCLCYEPDVWEKENEEYIFTSHVLRKKINPMLGKTVQHAFYDDWVAKASLEPEKRSEVLSKLFNVYVSAKTTSWKVTPDDVRRCQVKKRVTDCKFADGWQTYCGMDFSNGGDIDAIAYLSVDMNPTGPMKGRWFADCEGWITEEELQTSPNRPLYEQWVEAGWLHVCPGKVFNPDLAIHALMGKTEAGVNLIGFGYDPAQSKHPINTLKAWLQTMFEKRGGDPRSIAEAIKQMVVPVSQSAMNFNGLIGFLEQMVLNEQENWIEFSASPLWPWMAGNAKVETSTYSNMRIVKSSVHAKVDCIHALLDALYVFDLSEGGR